ncbi:hypothetical protein MMC07_005407 [Pseudocyphellaria aurata]|nr:hypothetical protein [Pseudocyphellaria aurata]
MATGRDQAHSLLEPVTQQPQYEAEQLEPLTNDPEKQVAIDDGKQCIEDKSGLEVAPIEASNEDFDRRTIVVHDIPGQRLSARRRKILCGLAGLTIILGAILGGVLGARHKNPATVSVTPTQRNIAAVSYTTSITNHTRVYFQDGVGQIIEASNSEKNKAWSINKTGFGGKNGSVIAAAVITNPGLLVEVRIFYLDVNNLIHDIFCPVSTGNCTSGTLSAQGYIAMSNSSLSAMYYWCSLCANTTIIAFQDENGFVQIGNFTSGGWTLHQLGQDLEPNIGTGLALQQFNHVMYGINLFYQNSGLNMSLATWDPTIKAGADNGWLFYPGINDRIPSGAHIAAAFISSPVAADVAWIQVLSLSTTGIKVGTWSWTDHKWLETDAYPMEMRNSTNNKKIYKSVAVTTIGNAFAVVKHDGQADAIENWQVVDDDDDWDFVGNVNLDGAWG